MSRIDKVTILLVDDNPANIFALEKLLEREDRELLNASNGNDALLIALSKNLELIILDVQMPGMDGFEVAQILKSNKKTKDVPIIFASAVKKEHQSIMKGFEEGAVDYLFKPLDPEITKAKVSVLLKLQLQKKELIEKNISLQKAEEKIKQLNSDLQKNVVQLELTNKELESFSYSVSHDLRAPLRAVDGYTKILEEDYGKDLDVEGLRLLEVIQYNAKKMGILIDDLLEFSRLGKKELKKTDINMNELIEAALYEIDKSIQHKAKISIEKLPSVKGDYGLLNQVIINLLSNAIKYSSKSEEPIITIKAEKKPNEVIYIIQDNGVGFEMEYAHKLFGVFQRLHGLDEFEGTGVGLAIVQRIVEKHGGQVFAEGKVDQGATFKFSLPIN